MRTHFLLAALLFFLPSPAFASTKVEIEKISGFGAPALARTQKVVSNIEKVINSEIFMMKVLTHKYKEKVTYFDNQGLTNEQIFFQIMSGAVTLDKTVDYTWKYNLVLKKIWSSSTTSYTTAKIKTIYVGTGYFKIASDAKLAGTLCHEYTHKAGFGHSMKLTPDRPFSVPYAWGAICTDVYKIMFP